MMAFLAEGSKEPKKGENWECENYSHFLHDTIEVTEEMRLRWFGHLKRRGTYKIKICSVIPRTGGERGSIGNNGWVE